jgi:hypothetical protein
VGIGAGINFSCSCEKGAILVLPDGASREDLRRLVKFRHAAEQNAVAWYEYARHCGLEPESLYLITGCVKTNSWGVASIYNASREHGASLTFTASSIAEMSASYNYSWETYSPADVRCGPKPPSKVHNQCAFLRGFKISFSENLKTLWSGKIGVKIVDETGETRHGTQGGIFRRGTPQQGRNQADSQSGTGASGSSGTSAGNTRQDLSIAIEMPSDMSEVDVHYHTLSDTRFMHTQLFR